MSLYKIKWGEPNSFGGGKVRGGAPFSKIRYLISRKEIQVFKDGCGEWESLGPCTDLNKAKELCQKHYDSILCNRKVKWVDTVEREIEKFGGGCG